MRRLIGLVLLAATPFAGSRLAADSPVSAPASVRLVLSGKIRNLGELSALVEPETHVQLVRITENDSYDVGTDGQGRFSYLSDLPRIPFPKTAAFTFVVDGVPPGRYFLAAQRLRPQGGTAGERPKFEKENRELFVVDVPARAASPLEIKAGKLIVWTH